jgi:hypothetical protein
MVQKHIMPPSATPVMDQERNRLSQPYHRYLGGLEELSKRTAANVADLAEPSTNAEIVTAFNALLAALQAADIQET